MNRIGLASCGLLAFAGAALADTGESSLILTEPAERWTYRCEYPSVKTGNTCALVDVYTLVEKKTDATPTGIVIDATTKLDDTHCAVTVAPDTGCGASGCRSTNKYQVITKANMADGDVLYCNARLDVRKVVYRPDGR